MPKKMTEEVLRAEGFEKINRDLTFLLECFAEMLTNLGEKELAISLPWFKSFPPGNKMQEQLLQVYSIAFQLLNLVEENTAAQVRRKRETAFGLKAESGLLGNQFNALLKRGITEKQITKILPSIRVEPVLTAHPTEAKRTAILEQHRALYQLLQRRENPMLTKVEQRAIRREIVTALERLWRTGETLLEKPDVATERSAALYYLRDVFPKVLHNVDLRFEEDWEDVEFNLEAINEPSMRPKLRFGCWVGGDRDGHPFVTAEVTNETLQELRLNALLVVRDQIRAAYAKLSLSSEMQIAPSRLEARLRVLRREVGNNGASKSFPQEPWREFLSFIERKLPIKVVNGRRAHIDETQYSYHFVYEIERDIHLLRDSLVEVGATRIAAADIHPLLRTLDVFGFHLAALDIRQNSQFHDLALSQLLEASGQDGKWFLKASETERVAFLNKELESSRPFLLSGASAGKEADAVLSCYRVLCEHIENYGPDGLGALIVSMTRDMSDLLIVYLLARETGLVRRTKAGLVCQLPVVPLFETIADLEAAPGIMDRFLKHPMTRRSLQWQQKNRHRALQGSLRQPVHSSGLVQQVMIGYSDSCKDKGIIASQWSLHRSQALQQKIAQKHGVNLRFFHGRGGSVGRGAGPTHRFLEALPAESVHGDTRVTEQGETIAQKYNNISTATYNIELLLAGVLGVALKGNIFNEAHAEETMRKLTEWSSAKYSALLNEPGFMEFYGSATPIDVLEMSGIGSRPSRRTGQRSLEDLRAIPWVFSWTQSRFYLPSWYGAGTALAQLKKESSEAFERLRTDRLHWPFINYLFNNISTSLVSANVPIMRDYAKLVANKTIRQRFMQIIEAEFELTGRMIGEFFESGMLAHRPRMAKTLAIREEPLTGLHAHQIRLLRKWRELLHENKKEQAGALRPHLLLSVNAIASGLRTTG